MPTFKGAGKKNNIIPHGRILYGHDGTDAYPAYVGVDGGLRVSDLGLDVARGLVSGMATINKFGRNTEIDSGVTADIWSGGKTVGALPGGTSLIWLAPTAACKHNIASTSGSDDGDPAGVGARTIRIYGLPDWDTAEVNEDIVMNGESNVLTQNTYVIIHRMKVLTSGATSINVGTITATASAPSNVTVTARIEVGIGQTEMAIYGVPSVEKLYLSLWYASSLRSVTAAAGANLSMLVNTNPQTQTVNFITKETKGIITAGSSGFNRTYEERKMISGPAIVKIQAVSGANDMDISSGFDGLVVDN